MCASVPLSSAGPSISNRSWKRACNRRSGFERVTAGPPGSVATARYPISRRPRRREGDLDRDALRKLLDDVRRGRVSVARAEGRLRRSPNGELGFATVDTHRLLRRGFPETIYGEGKTPAQIVAI